MKKKGKLYKRFQIALVVFALYFLNKSGFDSSLKYSLGAGFLLITILLMDIRAAVINPKKAGDEFGNFTESNCD